MADPEGVPWVPWNLCFEGLPLKILYANALPTLRLHWSYALPHVCQLQHQEFDARMGYVHVNTRYYQKHVQTIETMSEASERIKAYLCIAPSAARDSDMQSV